MCSKKNDKYVVKMAVFCSFFVICAKCVCSSIFYILQHYYSTYYLLLKISEKKGVVNDV